MPARELWFRALGEPAPKGSLRPVTVRGRTVLVPDNGPRLRKWHRSVKAATKSAMAGCEPLHGAIALSVVFYCSRPERHYTALGRLSVEATTYPAEKSPVTSGDIDKLVRAVMDAMTEAGAWGDDAQVCDLASPFGKRWASFDDPKKAPGVWVRAWEMEDQQEGLGL